MLYPGQSYDKIFLPVSVAVKVEAICKFLEIFLANLSVLNQILLMKKAVGLTFQNLLPERNYFLAVPVSKILRI